MQISYPASNKGVEMARIPRGAVASMLEKEATKNTIFFDEFTGCLPGLVPSPLHFDRGFLSKTVQSFDQEDGEQQLTNSFAPANSDRIRLVSTKTTNGKPTICLEF